MILAQAIPLVVCYMSLGVWDWSLKMVCAMWLTPLTLFWEGGKPSPICPLFDLAVIYCLQIPDSPTGEEGSVDPNVKQPRQSLCWDHPTELIW